MKNRNEKNENKNMQITSHDFLIYRNANDDVKVEVLLINKDIWLTQNLIAELFGVARSTITDHINNILKSGELDEKSTVGKTDIANSDKPVKIYNLDMIIAVGYRVNSKKATDFRIWATKILKEYMIKGVVMDDERLKNPNYIFSIIRNFALLLREFSCNSLLVAVIGFLVISFATALCPHIQTGVLGGQIQSVQESLKTFFTIRSSKL